MQKYGTKGTAPEFGDQQILKNIDMDPESDAEDDYSSEKLNLA